jgi:fluoroquinolone transport system permease protein
MMRLLSLLRWEVVLQFRYGFYYVSAFVVLVWVVVLSQFQPASLSLMVPGFLTSSLIITTFYFIGALVLLEKGEGTLEGLVVTPLRDAEYLWAKVGSLAGLALLENLAIVLLAYGLDFKPLLLLAGMLLMGVLYTLVGFVAIARYDSINEYLMPSVLMLLFLLLPLVHYSGLWQSAVFYLHPVQPSLVLMRAAFLPVATWEVVYGLLASLAWAAVAFVWARRVFHRFVVRAAGG